MNNVKETVIMQRCLTCDQFNENA